MVEETTRLTEERIKLYLEKGKRFDSRGLNKFRDISIEKDISKNAEGSVKVKLGKTEVVVGVKMSVGEPFPDSPKKGNLIVSAELSPMSSPRFESGPPKFDSIEIGRIVDRGIRESKFVDFEQLCIKEGEKVWNIFIDIYSFNDDGNLLDAAGIGAISALKIAKTPKYDEEEEKVNYEERSDKPLPLADKLVLPITIHKIENNLIVDPTREEEDIVKARVTIGISDGIISSMQKGDSEPFTVDDMEKSLEMAEEVWKDLSKKIEKLLK